MHVLVLYDITNDRIRTKVAVACEDYGLDRIQYSAFYGTLSRTHREELLLKIRNLLGGKAGRVQIVPVSAEDWEQRLEVNNDVG